VNRRAGGLSLKRISLFNTKIEWYEKRLGAIGTCVQAAAMGKE
jgi:hypothetical protein